MAIIFQQLQDFINMGLFHLQDENEYRLVDTTLRAARRFLADAEAINDTLIFYRGESA